MQRVNSLQGGQLDLIHTSDGQQVDALRQLTGQFNVLDQAAGRSEVRYYLMNAAKPPLDDLNARKAVAMAIDRDQINQIRNNGGYRIANGPFDTKVIGYTKNPGFPKYNLKQAKKLAAEYKAAHGGEFSVVLEHTNDPANTQEAELIKEQLGQGRDRRHAEAGRPDRVHHRRGLAATSASCCGAATPVTTPTRSTSGGPPARSLNFGKFNDPTLQGLLDQGRTETEPGEAQADLPGRQQALRVAGLQRVGLLRRLGGGRQEERAGPRRARRSPTGAASPRCSSTAANPCSGCT